MNQFIQILENRVLMSASAATLTADTNAVDSDAAATKTALAAVRTAESVLSKMITGDVKLVDTKQDRAANNKLVAALNKVVNSTYSKIVTADNSFLSNAESLAKKGEANGKALLAHPTSASLLAKVDSDITALDDVPPAKIAVVETALTNAETADNAGYSNIQIQIPEVAQELTMQSMDVATITAALSENATKVPAAAAQLATDLAPAPNTPAVTLTDLALFRGNSAGENQNTDGSIIAHGAWTSELNVQNVSGSYVAELFLSKVANPTDSQFITPAALSQSLSVGANTFYFFVDGDDPQGGSATFGLNVYLNGASDSGSATLSGYSVPGTGQTLSADSAAVTSSPIATAVPGAGTLSVKNGSSSTSTVTLSNFQILGVSGQGSTVDLVNSDFMDPFAPPPHPNGTPDTYGTFTITVTP